MTEAGMTHSQRLGEFGAGLTLADIPDDVVAKLKLHLVDAAAVAFAFTKHPLAAGLVQMATAGGPCGRATIIGDGARTSPQEAAFVNASFGHGKDFDDAHIVSITHPTIVVAPAVLALAEAEGRSGAEALTAIAFGIEVCARIGIAGGPAMARRGIPPLSACGALAAAAGAAKILALDASGIAAAIGVAGSFAAGSHEWTIAGGDAKFTTAGWAARSGVIAAYMAQDGFEGSMTAIEGRKGLLVAMAGPGAFDAEAPSAELGQRWEIRNLVLKRYASCQGTQAYILAAQNLAHAHAIKPEDVAEIEVVVGAGVGAALTEPLDVKRAPPDAYSAKFSIPFCVALAFSEGQVRVAHFDGDWEAVRSRVTALAQKVRHRIDTAFDIGAAERGFVRVRLHDGRVVETEQRLARNEMTAADIAEKFADCAEGVVNPSARQAITEAFLSLDRLDNVAKLMQRLGGHAG